MWHNLKMYNPTKYLKELNSQLRYFNTFTKFNQKSHYDTLGISAKATQADIKSAYYKLSMLYHPDKNENSEGAATKFRDISEAYEILGNVKSRKLYDKGLYIQRDNFVHDDIPLNKFYRSRETRSRYPTNYGRTVVYDFDEWSRSHYGDTFQKGVRYREKERLRKDREQRMVHDTRTENFVILIGLLFLFTAYIFYGKDYENHDNVTVVGSNIVVSSKSNP